MSQHNDGDYMDPRLDQKYVVIKTEDWNRITTAYGNRHVARELLEAAIPPGEFFVLRSSDVLAAGALHGYAHLMLTLVELSHLEGRATPLSDAESKRLADLADTISQVALEWQTRSRKIPD